MTTREKRSAEGEKERRKERRGDGDIRLVGHRPRYIREPSAVWRAFRTTMLSLRWDQIVGEGNEHISRDPAVKAQPARGSIPLEYLDIFVAVPAPAVYI